VELNLCHDAVAMGESASSLRSIIFGENAEEVAARSLGSVIVVRRERPPETTPENDSE
jgi:hypothetical protein